MPSSLGFILVLLVIGTLIFMVYKNQEKNAKNRETEIREKEKSQWREIAGRAMDKHKTRFEQLIRDTTFPVPGEEACYRGMRRRIWRDRDLLYIIPPWKEIEMYLLKYPEYGFDLDEFKKYEFPAQIIPVDRIEYFTYDGQIESELVTQGGGEGGASLSGAVLGGFYRWSAWRCDRKP